RCVAFSSQHPLLLYKHSFPTRRSSDLLGDPKYGDEASSQLSGLLKLQLHARRIELDHPGGGKLVVEAPISPEMKAGFAHFGFSEDEADTDPFAGVRRIR